ncbi:hypothetical protein B0H34DRAFT_355500 [Crassisporium funariophilum]|nr:hypothetical protein B0H34DRAFT_355500 [Crassisporium funariophilum]
MSDTPKLPPTPGKRQTKELPPDFDVEDFECSTPGRSELPPLDFMAAGGLVNFPREGETEPGATIDSTQRYLGA